MQPLRVALVHGRADPAHDGVADYTAHLAAALTDAPGTPDRTALDVVDVPVDPGPRSTLAAARALRSVRPDVVHLQFAPSAFGFSGWPGLLPLLLPRGTALVTTVHEYGWWSWLPERVRDRVPEAAWRRLERAGVDRETGRLVPASAAVLTTNDDHDAALRARFPGVADRLHRAPLLPNVEVHPAPRDRATVRRALGIAPDAEVVTFFGFVHPVKGLRYLVDAVAKLATEHPRLHLLVLGGFTSLALPEDEAESFRAELTAHVEGAGAADRVTIAGHRPAGEVSEALAASDVAAFPFTAGATLKSGALLAALDHGLPTIVTRRSDAPDDPALVDGESVVVAPGVRDVEVLVTALRRLLDDPELARRVAAGGHEIMRGHSWEALAAMHARLYEHVSDLGGYSNPNRSQALRA